MNRLTLISASLALIITAGTLISLDHTQTTQLAPAQTFDNILPAVLLPTVVVHASEQIPTLPVVTVHASLTDDGQPAAARAPAPNNQHTVALGASARLDMPYYSFSNVNYRVTGVSRN